MDSESPPKRVTRARAAAKTKTTEPAVKIATAAAKAKATRTMPVPATRRRTRADDAEPEHDEEKVEEPVKTQPEKPKTTRGRPKRAAVAHPEPEPEAEAPVEEPVVIALTRSSRGRPKKSVVEEPPAPEPVRSTRGRTRKVDMTEETPVEQALEPVRKVTRGRAATATKPATAPKKSVTFEDTHEPDKENIIPIANAKSKTKDAEPGTGIRAKPVRKTAVATRATRGRGKAAEPNKEKSPLSPKKATQVAVAKDSTSEDELATMEKTPMKPLTKGPIKVPTTSSGENKKLDFTSSVVANRAALDKSQDLGASIMASPARRPPQSPFKDTLKTSPKRTLGESLLKSPFKPAFAPPGSTTSPLKASLLQSPARRPVLPAKVTDAGSPTNTSFKTSFLQSPAKRPASPTKVNAGGSPSRAGVSTNTFGATPKPSTFSISRYTTPRTLNKNAFRPGKATFPTARPATELRKPSNDQVQVDHTFVKPFPGRLSAILPRTADPAMSEELTTSVPEVSQLAQANTEIAVDENGSTIYPDGVEPMDFDEDQPATADIGEVRSTTPTQSPPRHSLGHFDLRVEDQDPFRGSDSEDELASTSPQYSPAPLSTYRISSKDFAIPATPTPFSAASKSSKSVQPEVAKSANSPTLSRSTSSRDRREKIGFTPLARQLSDWMAASPTKSSSSGSEEDAEEQKSPTAAGSGQDVYADLGEIPEQSPTKSTFFDDEMSIRDEIAASADPDVIDAIEFAPAELDEQDLDLAAEADEMSLLDPDQMEVVADVPNDTASVADTVAISEASQEYGDENTVPTDVTMPIDPALLALNEPMLQQRPSSTGTAFTTPRRVMGERVFHTISKVALKPPADGSPVAFGTAKRSKTIAKLPTQRHAPPLPPAKTPTKQMPAKSADWSAAATPARTPRPDLNDQVLKGAVVFVDVHTSEGADASAVFVELLGWMGARCVKTWNWNPRSPENSENGAGAKVGITHVVFKDGGKRTLEKVRESNGIVLCVGVGWVLDCERNNSWLDEAPYAVDTSLVPRGGHRRRKSMEPKALANMNGTLTPVPASCATPRTGNYNFSPTREFLNLSDTPRTDMKIDRRRSTAWVRSPASDEDQNNAVGDETLILSPVPPTPAPEMISAYAENILDGDVEMTPYFADKGNAMHDLVQMTAPPKQAGHNGIGDLEVGGVADGNGPEKGVLMQRLLLARRKSLQWAPKVGSPLARGASYGL